MRNTNLRKKLKRNRLISKVKENVMTISMVLMVGMCLLTTGAIVKDYVVMNNTCEANTTNDEVNYFHNIYGIKNTSGAHSAIYESISDVDVMHMEKNLTSASNDIEDITHMTLEEQYEKLPTNYDCLQKGYITATKLNIREYPTTEADVIGELYWYNVINYTYSEPGWLVIPMGDSYGYISEDYVSTEVPDSGTYYEVNGDNYKRKSYMDYRSITSHTSRQWRLQVNYAYTGDYGIRMVNDRYCIALGQHYTNRTGTYVDVYLANGEVLKCILGDSKQWRHTQGSDGLVGADGGAVEFVVDEPCLNSWVRQTGSISYANEEKFLSQVVGIRVYNKNILD